MDLFPLFTSLLKNVTEKENSSLVEQMMIDPSFIFTSILKRVLNILPLHAVVFVGALGGFVFRLAPYLWNSTWVFLRHFFMVSVTVDESESIAEYLLDWLEEGGITKKARNLCVANSRGISSMDHEFVSRSKKSVAIKYNPDYGSISFCYGNRLFFLRRMKGSFNEDDRWEISSFGWSTRPIKQWIEDVKTWIGKSRAKTTIKRPNSSTQFTAWRVSAVRDPRPMDTIVMDDHEKEKVTKDMKNFLTQEAWYVVRGIPYRRGYLFHGKMGTGKSSLSYALAGEFDLDVYVISLLSKSLTDDSLFNLFLGLPKECIVLLEDIDSAGLGRVVETGDGGTKVISLAGLLNAIDGVGAQEGRILVLTTNKPDSLEDDLLRPGRIDMTVKFELATKAQSKTIFLRIYSETNNDHNAELVSQSEVFKDIIPEYVFSLAEIQGYLITKAGNAQGAVDEAETWVKNELKKRRQGIDVDKAS